MKLSYLLIFLTIVIGVYTSVNLYIFYKSQLLFNAYPVLAFYIKLIFWVIVASYPLGRIVERFWTNGLIDFLIKTGSLWMGFMLYLFLFLLLFDIFRLIIHFLPYQGAKGMINADIKTLLIKAIYLITMLIILVSFINARIPRVNQFSIQLNKSLKSKYKIVAVSDIHLGTIISKARLQKLVDLVNAQHPDIVLLVGDVFDEDIKPIVNNGIGELFPLINSKFGVFAVTGNHEFFGGVEGKVKYLESHGVGVLRDSSHLVDNQFYIIGRDDRQVKFTTGRDRKPLDSLISDLDISKPLILLDHQPFNLKDVADKGIDLQLSGHTHHGQLWPFNYITAAIYELSSGYLQKGNTHFIVSNGYGSWGPPLRLGNRPEILAIEIYGK